LVVAALVGACSTDGDSRPRPDTPTPFDAADAAAALRALSQIETHGEIRYGEGSGPLSGDIGYEPYRFVVRSAVPVASTDATATFVGVAERAWVRRATLGPDDELAVTGPLSLVMLRAPEAPPYLELTDPHTDTSWSVTAMFDPARVLDAAAAAGASFEPSAPQTIDGTERSAVRAELPDTGGPPTGLRDVTVWLDASGRPLRLAATTAQFGEVVYDIRTDRTPLVVQAPDEAAIDDPNVPLPDAIGPYTTVVETAAAGIPVTVLRAPAARGWTCWKVESNPPFRGLHDTRPSGGTCVVPPLTDDLPEDRYAIPLTSAADMPYALLGMLLPPGSEVELRRFGAEPVTATAGPTGLVLYTGPPTPVVGLALVSTPDAELVCGPAGVDNQADFAARDADGAANDDLIGLPWNCLSAADAEALSG
jgi:hypothetical protein